MLRSVNKKVPDWCAWVDPLMVMDASLELFKKKYANHLDSNALEDIETMSRTVKRMVQVLENQRKTSC